jgi:hypothetical protein
MDSNKVIRRSIWAGILACWGVVVLSTGLCCLPSDPPPKQAPSQRLIHPAPGPAPAASY